jgi:hypothetical protein
MRRETVQITASAFDERTILIHKNGKVCGELKVKDNGGHVPMTEIVRRINFDPAKTDSKAVGSVPIAPAVFERARLNESAKKTITPLRSWGPVTAQKLLRLTELCKIGHRRLAR